MRRQGATRLNRLVHQDHETAAGGGLISAANYANFANGGRGRVCSGGGLTWAANCANGVNGKGSACSCAASLPDDILHQGDEAAAEGVPVVALLD